MSKRTIDSRTKPRSGKLNVVIRWLPVLLRAVAVLIVLIPATAKFVQYADWVARFAGWGIPWPEVAVLVAGTVQIGAAVSLVVGIAGRFGAVALAFVMLVAMLAAGPDAMNATVFGSSVGIALLGTGPYSYWDPRLTDPFERTSDARTERETLPP